MKYMFVIDCNLSGGAERVVSNLVNYFSEKGNQVTLLNFDENSSFYYIRKEVKIVKLAKEYPKIAKKKNRISKRLSIIKNSIREIKRYRPDVVIPFLFDAEMTVIPFCSFAGISCITTVRNDADSYPLYQRMFRKLYYPKISGIVFQSKNVREHKDYRSLSNACVIPNPVAIKILDQKDSNIDKRKVISVGRLTSQKNHKMELKAMRIVVDAYPDIVLHIYGEGEQRKELEKMITELSLEQNVFLEGIVSDAQYKNRDSMAFIMASDYEGFPNALVEAMACQIPVICTDFPSGTAAEILENGKNGWLIKTGDTLELANAIINCINNPEKAAVFASRGVRKCKEYEIDVIGEKWMRFIEDMCNSRKVKSRC